MSELSRLYNWGQNFLQYNGNLLGDLTAPGAFMVATGGTITTDGDYKIHTFTSDGTFTVTTLGEGDVSALVVAGGGGGTGYAGGGGGAGGVLFEPQLTLTVTSYDVSVGAGGAGGAGTWSGDQLLRCGNQGGVSSFHTMESTGGGGGSAY